jgi:hypothetical protein
VCIDSKGLGDAQAEPLGGGQVLGSGRMWVSPAGEMDPRAVRVQLEGRNLPTESLLKCYLPKACSLSFCQVATKYRTCLAHKPAGSAEKLPIPFGLVSYIIVSLMEDLQLNLQCLHDRILLSVSM